MRKKREKKKTNNIINNKNNQMENPKFLMKEMIRKTRIGSRELRKEK